MNKIGTKNEQNQTVNEDTTCYVYAKMKWMRTFKAFDLEGFFPGKLVEFPAAEQRREQTEAATAGREKQLRTMAVPASQPYHQQGTI